MKKKYKIFALIVILCISTFAIITINKVNYSAEKLDGIDSFPDSYKPYLEYLHELHPNWTFTALYTGLDWEDVIDNENVFGTNLVPISYSDSWKNTTTGQYNVEVDSGWVDCSRQAVEYAMDPRNFLNEVRIFQFEALSYDEETNNLEGIEKILYGTEFYNTIVEYVTSTGTTVTTTSKYSDLILSAGQTSDVSSYHLASRIKQEVGPFLSHSSISGTVEGYEGLYNFYNIGATSSTETLGAIKNGLQYAKDGNGASQAVLDKYLIPWNTKERAITGGAIFIGSSYINRGQDTIYLQKFHVNDTTSTTLFWHQYMTNVLAPYSESKSIYTAYANNGMLDNSLNFIIPVYDNMPDTPAQSPSISASDFVEDNTKVYADVTTVLNVRTGPSTSYDVITTVDSSVIMTRIAKGVQSGELWDKVELPNGIVGYVFQSYLKEVTEVQVESINLSIDSTLIEKGNTANLSVEVLPENAENREVQFSSSDTSIATVDSDGNILAISSGTVTITVTAVQNNVSKSIEITVYTPVTDLQVNAENLTMQVDDKFIISPIITPTDADNQNVIYSSSDDNIATVDTSGIITANSIGICVIYITSEENSSYSKQIEITVVERLDDSEIIFDDSLTIDSNIITGIDVSENTVSNLVSLISSEYTIIIYDYNGKKLSDDDYVGTGCRVEFVDENNIIKMEYTVVIYGDVNGDGKINSIDLLVLQRHILEIEKLQGVFLIAGNISKNGKNPSALDCLLIQRHILQIKMIEQ